MKKRCIAVVLAWVLFVSILLPFREKSYADPFTAGQIASTAYAMMESWGIGFSAGSATAAGMNNFMASQVEDYVNSQGGSIADLFIGDIAVDAAGKLVVASQMYNSILEFTNWLQTKYDLSSVDFTLTDGLYGGKYLPYEDTGKESISGVGIEALFSGAAGPADHFYYVYVYNGGALIYGQNSGTKAWGYDGSFSVAYDGSRVVVYLPMTNVDGQTYVRAVTVATTSALDDSLSWNGANYTQPTVLNPDKAWTGTIGGYSDPDTNLDQLLGDINQAVADNNLVVDGEVIDVPVPPEPVPTWTPVDDVVDGINQMGEQLDGLGNDIGDISGHLDDMGDQIDGIEESLEGVQEGIQTQTGVISGALDQAAQDVVDAIGEQTATLDETLTGTAESVQDIASALTPGQISPKKFDLRGLFPFCIPFDIHNLLQKFNAEPVAPHVQLPFVIQSIGLSYMIDLDFSVFDPVAAVLRTVELIVFAIGLAWATSKVIKW